MKINRKENKNEKRKIRKVKSTSCILDTIVMGILDIWQGTVGIRE